MELAACLSFKLRQVKNFCKLSCDSNGKNIFMNSSILLQKLVPSPSVFPAKQPMASYEQGYGENMSSNRCSQQWNRSGCLSAQSNQVFVVHDMYFYEPQTYWRDARANSYIIYSFTKELWRCVSIQKKHTFLVVLIKHILAYLSNLNSRKMQ